MSKHFPVYLGIDVGMGPKPVTFVALDADQRALAIGEGDSQDVLAYAAGLTGGALAAFNAAARPNCGRMARPDVREQFGLSAKGRAISMRQVEYELHQSGMRVPETSSSPEKSAPWVRRGFALVEKLESFGYAAFQLQNTAGQGQREWLEVNADAAFWSLLGVVPLPAGTLEGRIQRQLALSDESLDVPDAMEFFEEVTRFKLLKSILPMKYVLPQPEINAWTAAQTAWLAANQPERIRVFGEPEEGIIYLPCEASTRGR